jgi:cytochrome c-type biogenesis protein
MTDLTASCFDAIAHADVRMLPVAFAAGAIGSFGPCVAPRYVAVAALAQRDGRYARTAAAFVSGLIVAYAAIGFGVGQLGALSAHAGALYGVLALALVGTGVVSLVCDAHPHEGQHHHRAPASASFLLGAGSALVVSPCCTPVVAAVAALGAAERDPVLAAAYLAVFAAGHAAPLLLLGAGGAWLTSRLERYRLGPALQVVSATLLLALGGYYGLLV